MKFRVDVTRVVPLLPPQRSRREFRRQGRRQRHPCVNIAHASSSTLAALPPRLANIQMPVFEHLFDSKVAQAFLTHSMVMERSLAWAENYGLPNATSLVSLLLFILSQDSPQESHSSWELFPNSFVAVVVDFSLVRGLAESKSVGCQFLPTLNYIVRPQHLCGYTRYFFQIYCFQQCINQGILYRFCVKCDRARLFLGYI